MEVVEARAVIIIDKMNKIILLLGIGVTILIGIFFVKLSLIGETVNGELDNFAQCLTDVGLKMYGTEWCSHCKNQKKLFGNSFTFVDYTDCDKSRGVCSAEGIQGYPTWKINGQSYPGEQSLDRLASLSGCELV